MRRTTLGLTALLALACSIENPPNEKSDKDIFKTLLGWSGHWDFPKRLPTTLSDSFDITAAGTTYTFVWNRTLSYDYTMKAFPLLYPPSDTSWVDSLEDTYGDTAQVLVFWNLQGNFNITRTTTPPGTTESFNGTWGATVLQLANFWREVVAEDPNRGWHLYEYTNGMGGNSTLWSSDAPRHYWKTDTALLGGILMDSLDPAIEYYGPTRSPGSNIATRLTLVSPYDTLAGYLRGFTHYDSLFNRYQTGTMTTQGSAIYYQFTSPSDSAWYYSVYEASAWKDNLTSASPQYNVRFGPYSYIVVP